MNGNGISQEQVMEQLKLLLPAVGGILTTLGFMTPAESAKWISSILNAMGPLMMLSGMIWGVLDKREKSLVAKVDTLAKSPDSPVMGVIVAPTKEGKELAEAVGNGGTTVPAGTITAAKIANNGV